MTADQQHNRQVALASIFDSTDWTPYFDNEIAVVDTETGLATTMPIADMAAAVLSAVAHAAAEVHSHRTGVTQTAKIDRRAASIAMTAAEHLRVDGEIPSTWDPLTRYYRTRDEKWLYLHTAFAHLRDGALRLLNSAQDRQAVSLAISALHADTIEQAAIDNGLTIAKLRTREEWFEHAHAQLLNTQPLIRLTRISDTKPIPLLNAPTSEQAPQPLGGLRTLDLSRVIAGPIAGRTLAEHGATVMRVGSPKLPSIPGLVIDTGFGKLSCHLDLKSTAGLECLHRLGDDADIVLDGYRPGALAGLGLSPQALSTRRPGIIIASLSAFSNEGPWAGRRGFDTLVQATTGLATENGNDQPRRLPCQPLDYMTGYLTAFGIMIALLKRAQMGGSWHVETSLARTANWIWEMSDHMAMETRPPKTNASFESISELLSSTETKFGTVQSLAPVIQFSETSAGFTSPPVPLGSHPPVWP